jgi:hypothetical protein
MFNIELSGRDSGRDEEWLAWQIAGCTLQDSQAFDQQIEGLSPGIEVR